MPKCAKDLNALQEAVESRKLSKQHEDVIIKHFCKLKPVREPNEAKMGNKDKEIWEPMLKAVCTNNKQDSALKVATLKADKIAEAMMSFAVARNEGMKAAVELQNDSKRQAL
jgi:hypothetical protein